jgi:oligopeptide/dipeptide ABC transporter ATP-binding protein
MYAGRIVERGPVDQVIEDPKHPYTRGLLACLPRLTSREQRIQPIPGNVPDLADLPGGCAFAPRCDIAREECSRVDLRLRAVTPGHYARCILYEAGERYTAEDQMETTTGE